MAKRLVILTVGTSLLTNEGGQQRINCDEVKELNEECSRLRNECGPERTFADVEGKCRDVLDHLNALCPAHEFALRSRPGDDYKDRLPQELSYLYKLLSDLSSGAEREEPTVETTVALIPTDTLEGEACAWIIGKYLKDRVNERDAAKKAPWEKISRVLRAPRDWVEGLKVDDANAFQNSGLPNLTNAIHNLVTGQWCGVEAHFGQVPSNDEEKCFTAEGDQVVINLTGGFKAVAPYVTLAAALLKEPNYRLHYLFEETPDIVELPAYPVGLDFPLWHRQAMLLEAAQNHPKLYGPPALDLRMESVLPKSEPWPRQSLPTLLQERYEQQVEEHPLQSYSRSIIEHFVQNADRRKKLTALLPHVGPLIWLGDKVPMAADHSDKHHHDLLEIAQVLLTPLQQGNEPFLRPEECSVLLAALMLHDCGHTLDALPLGGPDNGKGPLVPLLRSEIRKYHHFLAYYRLTDTHRNLMEGLDWQPQEPWAQVVAWLCLYHRSDTGWTTAGKAACCPYWDLFEVPPVMEADCGGKLGKLGDNVDFPKLVALLRIIDGCDNQSRRVGPAPTAQLMASVFRTDAETYRRQAELLLAAAKAALNGISASGCCSPWKEAQEFVDQVAEWLAQSEEAKGPPEIPWCARQELARRLAENNGANSELAAAALWTELARQVDECRLRYGQYAHFLKHEGVRRVQVAPADDFALTGCWHFNVTLVPDEGRHARGCELEIDSQDVVSSLRPEVPCQHETVRAWIWAEVKKEFQEEAICYLRGKNWPFRFTLQWSDRPNETATIPDPETGCGGGM